MTIKQSLPLAQTYGSELAYWLVRIVGWDINRVRIIKEVSRMIYSEIFNEEEMADLKTIARETNFILLEKWGKCRECGDTFDYSRSTYPDNFTAVKDNMITHYVTQHWGKYEPKGKAND